MRNLDHYLPDNLGLFILADDLEDLLDHISSLRRRDVRVLSDYLFPCDVGPCLEGERRIAIEEIGSTMLTNPARLRDGRDVMGEGVLAEAFRRIA